MRLSLQVLGPQSADPYFVYDAKAEAKLRRKIDFVIVRTASIHYLFYLIDRANIASPASKTTSACYNLIFSISYVIFEIPASVTVW
ncbi:hypothetical protein VUR80DRAFT_1506 [Thermomyces stellatus]